MNKDDRVNGKQLPARIPVGSSIKTRAKNAGGLAPITAEELDKVRRQVLDTVKVALPAARNVLSGTGRWTNQQVKLFQIMLNKVMPDLSHSQVDVTRNDKDPSKMTREELQEIIRRGEAAEKEEDADTVDAVYSKIPDTPIEEASQAFLDIEDGKTHG